MRHRVLLSAIIFSLCLLVSCAAQTAVQEPLTLQVLTEHSPSDGMNYQVEQIAAAFMEGHDGVTVEIEYLPTDAEERSLYLYQLRVEIMSGQGPDVYLLPTRGLLYDNLKTYFNSLGGITSYKVEPLFSDVVLAMENGVFQDVSTYYDNDHELHTENLHQTVMDAGIWNGARYLLPIRYNMPVLITDPNELSFRLTSDLTILDLAEKAIAAGDTAFATALQMPEDFSAFSQLLDYKAGSVLVSQDLFAKYLLLYQQVKALCAKPFQSFREKTFQRMWGDHPEQIKPSMEEWEQVDPYGLFYYYCETHSFSADQLYWQTEGFPIFIGDICSTLHNAAINQYLGTQTIVQPLRCADGSIAAEVTFYGAVGASCESPELAYDFLREFLTEEAQWDLLRPRSEYANADIWNIPPESQCRGFVENSWPVRTKGSVQHLWDTIQYQIYSGISYQGLGISSGPLAQLEAARARAKRFKNAIILTDEDLPILFTPIDEVRFPITLPENESMAWALAQLNEEDGTPTDVDIDALAEQLHQNLWWHLAEG